MRSHFPVLLAVLSLLALAGLVARLHLSGPSNGARVKVEERTWTPTGLVVTAIDERPGGLRTGDLVVAVNGREGVASIPVRARDALTSLARRRG